MDNKKININICMGSSCFTRGNALAVKLVEEYITENNLENCIKISGSLCMENCSLGPNIIINEKVYSRVDPDCIIDLLKHHLA